MWDEQQRMEEVEAYAENRLTGPEREAFEKRMAVDALLTQQVRNYLLTRQAISDVLREQRMRALMDQAETTLGERPERRIQLRWAAAASIALLVVAGGWYLLRSKASLPALAERYAVHESALPVLMTGPQDHRNELDPSMQLFGAGRYAQALAELDRLPTSDTVAFFAGLCAVELGQDPSARFQPVIDDSTSGHRAKALYQLMLWHLKHDQRADAASLLNEQLRISDHPYRKQLEELAADKTLLP